MNSIENRRHTQPDKKPEQSPLDIPGIKIIPIGDPARRITPPEGPLEVPLLPEQPVKEPEINEPVPA